MSQAVESRNDAASKTKLPAWTHSSCAKLWHVSVLEIGLFQKKPAPPPADGILEILAGGGIKDPGNPGRRGGLN